MVASGSSRSQRGEREFVEWGVVLVVNGVHRGWGIHQQLQCRGDFGRAVEWHGMVDSVDPKSHWGGREFVGRGVVLVVAAALTRVLAVQIGLCNTCCVITAEFQAL